MSTGRLRRIGREYRNEHYRVISGIFPLQYDRKISACAPLTFLSCTAVTDMSFRQHAVIEFPVKDGNSAGFICERLRGVYGDVCMVLAMSEGG
jgi:hypothetical protein